MTAVGERVCSAVLAALVFVALLACAGPAAGAGTAAPVEQRQGVDLRLDSVEPATLTPGSMLRVLATVTNRTNAPLAGCEVRLWLRQQPTSSRDLVEDWADGRLGTGTLRTAVPLGEPLPPGSSRPVAIALEAGQLGLPSDAFQWGPRGMAVEVLDGSLQSRALTRSFVVWRGDPGGYEPTDLTLVLPLTDGAPDVLTGQIPPESLEQLTAPQGRLRAVLAAAALPGITWALDPAVLAADSAASGATASPASPEAEASAAATPNASPPGTGSPVDPVQDWQNAVRQAAVGHEVVVLPYGDPDVNALARAGQRATNQLAEQYGREAAEKVLGADVPGVTKRFDVAWPVNGSLDDQTVAMLVSAGRSNVVLSGGSHPPARSTGSTPTGRSQITVDGTSIAGLLVDTRLSTLLGSLGSGSQAPHGTTAAPTSSATVPSPAAAVQRLLAETAAITLERPFDPRHILVTAPRGWDPESEAAVAAVRALTGAPWVRARSLGDLIAAPAPELARAPLRYPDADREAELPGAGLRHASAALASIRTTAAMLTDPAPVLRGAELSAVAAASSAWRDRRRDWRAGLDKFSAQAASLANGVQALPGSGITVVSSKVSLPITLQNTLDQEATVRVQLQPRSSRLVVEDSLLEEVPIGAHSQRRVSIPVRAVGNGNTDVVVQVLTPEGVRLGTPVVLTVRVRADWESRGTLLLGIAIGLVLLVGLVRAVRRGRRRQELRNPIADGPQHHGATGGTEQPDRAPEAQERGA